MLLVVWLVRGSVLVRYKKLIFKVFLKFLHISCYVNCFIKWPSFDVYGQNLILKVDLCGPLMVLPRFNEDI